MAFKMTNPLKQKKTSGYGPVEKCPDGKVWCKTLGDCVTLEACEDAEGKDTNIKTKKVHVDPPKKKVHGVKNPGNWQPHQFR